MKNRQLGFPRIKSAKRKLWPEKGMQITESYKILEPNIELNEFS